jgi:hypothetical protein
MVSAAPFAPPFRKDLAKSMCVEPVPEKVRDQKLKLKDEQNGEAAQQTDAARGFGQRQRKNQLDQEKAQRKAAPQVRESG